MSDKEDKLSNNIRDWQFKDKLVIFEEFKSTLKRSESNSQDEFDSYDEDDEEDLPVKLKEMAYIHTSQIQSMFHPEMTDPDKHFKLWTIYTKVPLTTKLCIKIENTIGIESLEVISRYRARIGIAPLFKDGLVMKEIKALIHQSIVGDIDEISL